jgi:Inner membrane protein YgaP-like, transmembrane domain
VTLYLFYSGILNKAKGGQVKKNIGGIDKGIRIVIGVVLMLGGIFYPMSTGWRIGVLIIAGITLINAFIGL